MKKLRAIIKKLQNSYVPTEPVHYKMEKNEPYVSENPVHFKMIMAKTVNESKINHEEMDNWLNHNDNTHLGNNSDAISKKLEKPADTFTKHELKHIDNYTDHSYSLNKYLVAKHRNENHPPIMVHEKTIDHLDSATKKPIGHEVHLYSGLSFNPEDHLTSDNDHIMHLPAYTSATHGKRTAYGFAASKHKPRADMHILHIHMKPTDKGVHVNHIGASVGEHETILPRNTKVKLNSTPKSIKSPAGVTHIWHATVHND